MFQNIYPVFEKKRLLKKEMLDNLRDYPRNLFGILHQDYGDGILAGCELKGDADFLTVLPGILLYKGVSYVLDKPYRLPVSADGQAKYLKVRLLDRTIGDGQEEYLSQIYIDEKEPEEKREMELGRFKLQSGARLRTEYVDFDDYETEYDTVNRIHVPYAEYGGSSIWGRILKSFADEMMGHALENPWDYAFCVFYRRIFPVFGVRIP